MTQFGDGGHERRRNMPYFVESLYIVDERHIKVFCISTACSVIILKTKIAFRVPLSVGKPYYSSAPSPAVRPRSLFKRMRITRFSQVSH